MDVKTSSQVPHWTILKQLPGSRSCNSTNISERTLYCKYLFYNTESEQYISVKVHFLIPQVKLLHLNKMDCTSHSFNIIV